MPRLYKNFVQVGRVVQIHRGDDAGKLAVILDVVDQNRLLVDGPATGVARQVIKTDYVNLTPQVVKVGRGANAKVVKAAFETGKVVENYNNSGYGKRLAKRATRQGLTDFERFQVQVQKKQRNVVAFKELNSLRAAHNTANPAQKLRSGRF